MGGSLPDNVARVTGNAIDALKVQPALLFLILLNCIVFATSYFALDHAEQRKSELFTAILQRCTFNYASGPISRDGGLQQP